MRNLCFIMFFVLLGCATPLRVAQTVLEPYSFYAVGSADGVLGVNSRYIAVDAEVDLLLQYRAPEGDVPGNPIVVRWEKLIKRGAGKRAYRVDFGIDGKFVRVVSVSWDEARSSMPFLPENTDENPAPPS